MRELILVLEQHLKGLQTMADEAEDSGKHGRLVGMIYDEMAVVSERLARLHGERF